LIANSAGSALAGLGPAILFKAESSTTDSTIAGRIWAAWTTVTHATRKSKIGFHAVYNGSEVEVASFDATNSGDGRLLIGASSPAVYAKNGITIATSYTIGGSASTLILGGSSGIALLGGSTGAAQISSSGTSTSTILFQATANAASSTSGIDIGGGTSLTQTSATRNYVKVTIGFAPTSGTAVHNSMAFTGTFNQTGGASGITRGIFLNQTLTAVADMRLIEIAADGSNTKGIYQTGASVVNNFVGATAFGTTSAPDASAIVDIVSTAKGLGLPAMTTAQVNAISSPRDGLTVYDTDTDTVKVRANGAWVSLGTGSGTITGSGSAGQIAYWSGAIAITGENALFYDATNDRLGVGTAAPSQSIDIRGGRLKLERTDNNGAIVFVNGTSSDVNTRVDCDTSGNIIFRTYGSTVGFKTYDTNAAADVFEWKNNGQALAPASGGFYIPDANTGINASQSSGNLTLNAYGGKFHFRKTNGGTNQALLDGGLFRIGDDTTPTARLSIAGQGTTSSTYGVKVFDAAGTPVLLFAVQDNGVVSGNAFQTNSAAPTTSYGTGAGTGPVTDLLAGGQNGFNFFFTTGTSPAASATVVTINLPKSFANGCAASWVAANAATQAIIGNFWLSGTANNSITIAYAGTLAASTAYGLSVTIIGY
jgi:hypothetical protein